LAAQHRELVAQDQDLRVLGGVGAASSTSGWMERQGVR
jgi:hypothetical protein